MRPFVSSVLPLPRLGVDAGEESRLTGIGLSVSVSKPFKAIKGGLRRLDMMEPFPKPPEILPFWIIGSSIDGSTASSISSSLLNVAIAIEGSDDFHLGLALNSFVTEGAHVHNSSSNRRTSSRPTFTALEKVGR